MTWWKTKKGNPKPRFIPEVTKLKALFNPDKDTKRDFGTSWDVPFVMRTLVKLEFKDEDVYFPQWTVEFTMRNSRKGIINPKDTFTMLIVYSETYPAKEAYVYVPSHKNVFTGTSHRFGSGALCLHNHQNARTGWDPAKSTAATVALWGIQWIRTFYYWKETGKWPDKT